MPDDEKPKPAIRAIPRSIPPRLTLTRVALYCRVSTQMERQLNSLSAQMDFQRQDILDHPLWEYIDTYTDIGSGRSINSRPGFKRLMTDCEAGRIDLIYTKSISRLGRNCVDFLIVLRRLKELGVDVYFQNEGIFLSNESSELILSLHAALAQAESENKSTDICWGIRKSTTNPDSPAFSIPCFGYIRNEDNKLIINEKEAETVNKIFSWYEQGWSIVRIKKELETLRIPSPRGKRRWAVRTISDMLSNEKYAGNSAYGKTVIAEYPSMRQVKNSPDKVLKSENHHPAIIDKVLFNRIQEMRRIRTNVEVNEQGNKVRKNTHYSMKRPLDVINDQTETEEV